MDELDFLERHLIGTLTKCSIFTFDEIAKAYFKNGKSWDLTILAMKKAASSDSQLQLDFSAKEKHLQELRLKLKIN